MAIVADYGISVLSNPALLANLCADEELIEDAEAEANLIIDAARVDVVRLLRERAKTLGTNDAIEWAARSLAERHSLDLSAARWVVGEFALAIELEPETATPGQEAGRPDRGAAPVASPAVDSPAVVPPPDDRALSPAPGSAGIRSARDTNAHRHSEKIDAAVPVGPQHELGVAGNSRASHRRLLLGTLATLLVAAAVVAVLFGVVLGRSPPPHHPSADSSASPDLAAQANQLVDLINQTRSSHGVPGLIEDPQLTHAASVVAAQLAPTQSANVATVRPKVVAEVSPLYPNASTVNVGFNVVPDTVNAQQAYEAEINSPAHFQNYVDPSYDYLGVGISKTPSGLLYILEVFVAAINPSSTGTTAPS